MLRFIFGNRNSISHRWKNTKLVSNCCLTHLVNETFLPFKNNPAMSAAEVNEVDVNGGGVTKCHSCAKFQCRLWVV